MGGDSFPTQHRGFDFFAVIAIQLFFDPRENAGGAAGANELDASRFPFMPQYRVQERPDLGLEQISHPVTAGAKFRLGWGVGRRKLLQQPHRAEAKTVGESFFPAMTENEFRATAADIQNQERRGCQRCVGGHAAKNPVRLACPGDDFGFKPGCAFDGVGQLPGIDRVAGGAGGYDANGDGAFFAGGAGKIRDDFSGMGDGARLQLMGFVEPLAQPGLPAFLEHRAHLLGRHIGDEQFYRVGPDINDGAAHGFHGRSIKNSARGAKSLIVTFTRQEFVGVALACRGCNVLA